MRLLHSQTLKLQEFFDSKIPAYSILSHTWDQDEISFQAMQGDHAALEGKAGYTKILSSCQIAAKDGFDYIWIDTCCIDKTSSAELSEAINSMFRYYKEAEVCYIYLSDVHNVRSTTNERDITSQFRHSRWFKRGWTLQELIAPRSVLFYNQKWEFLGTKSSLEKEIANTTSIERHALSGESSMSEFSVAQRMSWAAHRETTRLEDRAYSLMGIFDVKMPMLYGEGEHAFFRLQEQIFKVSDDHSIFAWSVLEPNERVLDWPVKGELFHRFGMLAPSPSYFASSGSIIGLRDPDAPPFALTNKGLSIELPQVKVGGKLSPVHGNLLLPRKSGQAVLPRVLAGELILSENRDGQIKLHTVQDEERTFMVLDCFEKDKRGTCLCVEVRGVNRVGYKLIQVGLETRRNRRIPMFLTGFETPIRSTDDGRWIVIDTECLKANGLRVVESFPTECVKANGKLRFANTKDIYPVTFGVLKFHIDDRSIPFLLIFIGDRCILRACTMFDNIMATVKLLEKEHLNLYKPFQDHLELEYPEQDVRIDADLRMQKWNGERIIRVYINVRPRNSPRGYIN